MSDEYDNLYFFFKTRKHHGRKGKKQIVQDKYSSYCYFDNDEIGVFVPAEDLGDFRESFSNVILETAEVDIGDMSIKGLRLRCPEMKNDNDLGPFTVLCTSFIDTKEGRREKLISDPFRWCESWRNTLGNKEYERNAYPVIGELMLVKELMEKGYDVIWTGPDRGINDVTTLYPIVLRFEVKSTINRGSRSVQMSEEFQIPNTDFLCFYRFEEVEAGGTSINSMMEELMSVGMSPETLDEGLLKTGLENTSERTKEYKMIEKCTYKVDENFPDIMRYFIDGKKPGRINNISYALDLAGLEEAEIPLAEQTGVQ